MSLRARRVVAALYCDVALTAAIRFRGWIKIRRRVASARVVLDRAFGATARACESRDGSPLRQRCAQLVLCQDIQFSRHPALKTPNSRDIPNLDTSDWQHAGPAVALGGFCSPALLQHNALGNRRESRRRRGPYRKRSANSAPPR